MSITPPPTSLETFTAMGATPEQAAVFMAQETDPMARAGIMSAYSMPEQSSATVGLPATPAEAQAMLSQITEDRGSGKITTGMWNATYAERAEALGRVISGMAQPQAPTRTPNGVTATKDSDYVIRSPNDLPQSPEDEAAMQASITDMRLQGITTKLGSRIGTQLRALDVSLNPEQQQERALQTQAAMRAHYWKGDASIEAEYSAWIAANPRTRSLTQLLDPGLLNSLMIDVRAAKARK